MDIWSRLISSPPILAYFIILAVSLGFGLGLFFLFHRIRFTLLNWAILLAAELPSKPTITLRSSGSWKVDEIP